MRTLTCLALVGGLLAAQQSKTGRPERDEVGHIEETIPKFTAPVTNILVPAKVFGADGNFLTGVRTNRFHLFDNGKEQRVHVDESIIPISMVIAIQCNSEVDGILPKVNRIGSMIGPLVLGAQGEAAVIAFDSRIRTMQDFTSDPDRIAEAVKRIHSGSISSRLVDAVDAAEHMLRSRPADRQKIILLIGETRDEGSVNRGLETLDYVQANNVTVYVVTMSRVLGKLTAPPPDPPVDPRPPAVYPMPAGVPATPTTVMQTYGTQGASVNFVPLLTEIFRNFKALLSLPAADLFTRGTGGSKFDFYRGKGLEEAIQQMGAELHLQYMLSYSPNNQAERGWHDIRVEVSGGDARVRTRPGYWMPAEAR
jgi:VWFA-related protein